MIIKFRNILLVIMGILFLIGAYTVPATSSGQTQSLFDSFIMSITLVGIHLLMWSDYIYNDIFENGFKINYKLYQYIGLVGVSIMLIIILNAYYL